MRKVHIRNKTKFQIINRLKLITETYVSQEGPDRSKQTKRQMYVSGSNVRTQIFVNVYLHCCKMNLRGCCWRRAVIVPRIEIIESGFKHLAKDCFIRTCIKYILDNQIIDVCWNPCGLCWKTIISLKRKNEKTILFEAFKSSSLTNSPATSPSMDTEGPAFGVFVHLFLEIIFDVFLRRFRCNSAGFSIKAARARRSRKMHV